jgi:pimeloyl-ACP methyl ester carboxylesterase
LHWVLLRGLGRSQEHWGAFPTRLRRAFPAATVETPDLPGFGHRYGERAPLTIPETLEAVRATVEPRRELVVMGLSLGGMVGYEWARRYPGELSGLVLVNSSLGGMSPFWRRMRAAAGATLVGAALSRTALARERRLFALTSGRADLAEATVASWVECAERQPPRAANVLRQLVSAARYRPPRLAPPPKLLVLASACDRIAHPACSRAIAAALGVPIEEHSTAGHDLPLDDPDWVVEQVRSWLIPRTRTEL